MSVYPEFARLVNAYLRAQDRSPTWLARQLDIHHSTVNRWLNLDGRPGDPKIVLRIADILGVHTPAERQALLTAAGYSHPEEPQQISTSYTQQPIVHSPHLSPPFMVPSFPLQGVLGRERVLARLFEMLALDQPEVTNVRPVAIQGMGGIGKTTVAIALARLEAVSYVCPDGILWVSAGPTPAIRNILNDWGRILGVDLTGERDIESCQHRLRSALHYRRMLLIVDDLWEVQHGVHFLVAGPHCRLLLTARESPVTYTLATRARTLRLDVLSPAATLELLRRLAPEAIRADVASAKRLCERLEYLPLALILAGRLLAQEADVPTRMQRLLSELIERREARLQLLQAEGRLGLDEAHPVSLQAILGMSIERLNQTDQARFAMLAVFGAEPLYWDLEAAAHVWECSLEAAELTISNFIQRGLVMRRYSRYWTHALLADYAAEMMERMGL